MAMISYNLVFILVLTVSGHGYREFILLGKMNEELLFNSSCPSYTDCFNCSLAACTWLSDGNCHGRDYAKRDNRGVNMGDFFENKHPEKCGDPLKICTHESAGNLTSYGFGSNDSSKIIPPAYFCTVKIDNRLS